MEKQFYRFRPSDEKNCIRIETNINYEQLDIIGEESKLLLSQGEFKIAKGKKAFDLIQFNDSLNFAISKRMKDLLIENNVTGWGCFPVEIQGLNAEYFIFQNLSKAGPILNLEAVNNYETENREFDINTWDGSDIFNLEDTLLNVCTKRVMDIMQKEKITNLDSWLL